MTMPKIKMNKTVIIMTIIEIKRCFFACIYVCKSLCIYVYMYLSACKYHVPYPAFSLHCVITDAMKRWRRCTSLGNYAVPVPSSALNINVGIGIGDYQKLVIS